MSKAQISMEFLLLLSVGIAIAVVFTFVIATVTSQRQSEAQAEKLEEYAYHLQSEILVASQVKDGYHHTLYVPNLLEGADYTIEINQTELVLTLEPYSVSLNIPQINGTIVKGKNIIQKKSGMVMIS